MLIKIESVSGITCRGRSCRGKKLILQCDTCKAIFERRYSKASSKAEYHFDKKECSNIAQRNDNKIAQKKKNTFLLHFGVDHPLKNAKIIEKIKNTSTNSQEKKRNTTLRLYGVEHTWQSIEIKEKRRLTCLQKFGVEHPLQNKDVWEKYWVSRKLKGNFRSSKIEDLFHKMLITTFNKDDVSRHVIINGWEIDFFVKSINTYIQLDGKYWHGLDRPLEIIAEHKTPRDVVIHGKFLFDIRQSEWFKINEKKLIRFTDEQIKKKEITCTNLHGVLTYT